MNDKQEKMNNAGNPLLLLFIFGVILAFLFFVPNIYEKYNTDKAALYGIGSNNEKDQKNKETEDVKKESSYFGIGGNTEFDNFTFSNASISENIFSIKVTNKLNGIRKINSDDYYIEFYKSEKEKTFLGRRIFKSDENIDYQNETTIAIDISGITTDENTVMRLIYIAKNLLPEVQLDNNTLVCIKGNETYNYEFDDSQKLVKLDYKITLNNDENTLSTYRLLKEKIDNLNGTTTNITEEDTNFTFNTVLDYKTSKIFNINIDNLYDSNALAKTIKFENDAKGYDCK